MQIKYDNEIAIALGKSRKEMQWKNRDIMWSLFIQKLSETHKTHETLAEYLKSDKSRQDEIKDIGGRGDLVRGPAPGGLRIKP